MSALGQPSFALSDALSLSCFVRSSLAERVATVTLSTKTDLRKASLVNRDEGNQETSSC